MRQSTLLKPMRLIENPVFFTKQIKELVSDEGVSSAPSKISWYQPDKVTKMAVESVKCRCAP